MLASKETGAIVLALASQVISIVSAAVEQHTVHIFLVVPPTLAATLLVWRLLVRHSFAARCCCYFASVALSRGRHLFSHVDRAQSRGRHCRPAPMLLVSELVVVPVIVERVRAPRVDIVWDGNSRAFTF